MSTVFEDLRTAREQRRMTLSDVAEATLINVDFLRAIDQGNIAVLPEAYIRAFMREYAAVVGLDPAAVMQKFDHLRTPPAPSPHEKEEGERTPQTPTAPAEAPAPMGGDSTRNMILAIAIIGAVLVLVVLWNIFGREGSTVRERPFQDVVKENEHRTAPAFIAGEQRPSAAQDDSLTLSVHVTDSVWTRVMFDNSAPREFFLRPGTKAVWRAKERFLFFTIGNAGAFHAALNGKDLGPLGKTGKTTQRLMVTAKGLVQPDSSRH